MDEKTRHIIWEISLGESPQIIESGEKTLVLTYICDYFVNGTVCEGKKQFVTAFPDIKETKSGRKYVTIKKTKFYLDDLKPCTIEKELLESELSYHMKQKLIYESKTANKTDKAWKTGFKNTEFYIKNLTAYIESTYGQKNKQSAFGDTDCLGKDDCKMKLSLIIP